MTKRFEMTKRIVSLGLAVAALALAAGPPAFAQTRVERLFDADLR